MRVTGWPRRGGQIAYEDRDDVLDLIARHANLFARTTEGWRFRSRQPCSHLAEPLADELR